MTGRILAGEYYGKSLEFLRHWESVTGSQYLGMGADEVYAYGVQYGYDAMVGKFGLNEMMGGMTAPGGPNTILNRPVPTERPDENIGAIIDGMHLNPSTAKMFFEGTGFDKLVESNNIDWGAGTGDALTDAHIAEGHKHNDKYYIAHMQAGMVNGEVVQGSVILKSIEEVDLAGWYAAHVSQANAAKFLSSGYVGDKGNNNVSNSGNGGITFDKGDAGGYNTKNFTNVSKPTGTSLSVLSKTLTKGANTDPLKGSGTVNIFKENAAAKYFKTGAKYLKIAGNTISGINLGIGYIQYTQGDITGSEYAYDIAMFGLGKVPYGIPFAIVGSIYKDEIMEWGRNLPPAPPMNSHNRICFIAGTPVLIDNQLVNIEFINMKDSVSSYSFDKSLTELMRVNFANVKKSSNIYKITTTTDTFVVTSEHPFYVLGKEWVEAKNLKIGYELKNISDIKIEVLDVKKVEGERDVYNIEVDNNNNFFVGKGKVLVHNSKFVSIEEINNSSKIKLE